MPFIKAQAILNKKIIVGAMVSAFGIDLGLELINMQAAQIHVESAWNNKARNKSSGAQGFGQFLPSTAKWASQSICSDLGSPKPYNQEWSIRCNAKYMRFIYNLTPIDALPCDRYLMSLAGYHYGQGTLLNNINKAKKNGIDYRIYFGGIDQLSSRYSFTNQYVAKVLDVARKYRIDGYDDGFICY